MFDLTDSERAKALVAATERSKNYPFSAHEIRDMINKLFPLNMHLSADQMVENAISTLQYVAERQGSAVAAGVNLPTPAPRNLPHIKIPTGTTIKVYDDNDTFVSRPMPRPKHLYKEKSAEPVVEKDRTRRVRIVD